MTDITLMKTNDYRLDGDTETWNLALGGNDFPLWTTMTLPVCGI